MILAVLALSALDPPPVERPSVTALAGVIYWTQCVVYGADDLLGSRRTTEEIVEIRMRACESHERTMQETLRVDLGSGADAHLPGYRDMVQEMSIRQIAERRQQPAPARPSETPPDRK